MKVFRLCKRKYGNDLSGRGAEIAGGRWNSKGTAMLYTSDSRSLCTAEIAVHTPLGIVPTDYVLLTIEVPDDIKVEELNPETLPADWSLFPHSHSTQLIGDEFISSAKSAVLRVPSAIVQGDYNYLLNPRHEDFKRIELLNIEAFEFNGRLFKIQSSGT